MKNLALKEWLEAADVAPAEDTCTDLANAKRFAVDHREDVRYCYAKKSWLTFDGRRWAWDAGDEIMRRAKATALRIDQEVLDAANADARKALRKHATYTQSAPGLKRMVELAQSEVPITMEALDADPDLLCCPNGTVDLRTSELRPHRREDFMTMMTATAYDPAATHPVYEAFLTRAVQNPTTRQYVQRAAGYSITGQASEEAVFFPHGPTAGGKTTLLEAIRQNLGDYASAADFDTLAPRKATSGPREDLARLHKRRWVSITEIPPGRRWALGLLKGLSGRDALVVRGLYQNSFEMVPTFKVWVAGNVRPPAPADEDALWRRLKEIPFTMSLAATERDPSVKTTLTDPKQGGPAVLAWLVAGAKAWYEQGLGSAPEVDAATLDYQQDMDIIGDFLRAVMVMDSTGWVSVAELRAAVTRYCHDESIATAPTGKELGVALRKRSCTEKRRHGGERGWLGLRLRTIEDVDPEPVQPQLEAVTTWA